MTAELVDGGESADSAAEGTVPIVAWRGSWPPDDPNASFKADAAAHAPLEPMRTIRGLAEEVGLTVGALVHYVLARYATSGSAGLLEIGPAMVERLCAPIDRAESSGDDRARLAAYRELRDLLCWLRAPLGDDGRAAYEDPRADADHPPDQR